MLLLSLHKAFFFDASKKIMILLANLWYFDDTFLFIFREVSFVIKFCVLKIYVLFYIEKWDFDTFFEKKDLYVRIFVGSLSLAYFFQNFILALSLLLEESCSANSSPFYDCVPSHNFFRNFFAKSFVVSIIIVTFAVSYPYWKLQLGEGGMDIYT